MRRGGSDADGVEFIDLESDGGSDAGSDAGSDGGSNAGAGRVDDVGVESGARVAERFAVGKNH